ncbi:immunoglobulin-like domain-containing protein [Bacillus litorisediminis]|uniref:immunoglobulin-like domain-containing protein n=1 Tax=Bacillus litorisediminis TaxID=2922713 RepID=UPI001FAD0C9B|nr:immunoglobulin-like domain-containing protein [Bacillus litorisediminis]
MRVKRTIIILIGVLVWVSACSGTSGLYIESKYNVLESEINKNKTSMKIYTDNQIYTLPVQRIILKFENNGTSDVNFGESRYIEKLVEGKWYLIPYKELGFNDIGLTIKPGESVEQRIPLEFLDYKLTEGLYRIPKSFNDESENFVIAAEFEIKE